MKLLVLLGLLWPTIYGEQPTTTQPTTQPTSNPITECTAEINYDKSEFLLMAMKNGQQRFHFNGQGWYYYLFPCDMDNYYNWPFFLLGYHKQDSRLILNTHPAPWIIDFAKTTFSIIVGTDENGQTQNDFNTKMKYSENNPLVIQYNDGQDPPQYGELRIFYVRRAIVLQLYDVGYDGYPRTCDRGEGYGVECGAYTCDGEVIDIRYSRVSSLIELSCPECLRNIACGLMGKYERGDCTMNQMKDPNNKCYNILVGSDGEEHTPPTSDAIFYDFAIAWEKAVVDAAIVASGHTVNYAQAGPENQDLSQIYHSEHGLQDQLWDTRAFQSSFFVLFMLFCTVGMVFVMGLQCISYCVAKIDSNYSKKVKIVNYDSETDTE